MVLRISRAMFLKMLESFPDAAQRLRELIAARADQWAREMENVAPRWRAAPDRALTVRYDQHLQRRRHRHVVGRTLGAAIVLGDGDARDAVGELGDVQT